MVLHLDVRKSGTTVECGHDGEENRQFRVEVGQVLPHSGEERCKVAGVGGGRPLLRAVSLTLPEQVQAKGQANRLVL